MCDIVIGGYHRLRSGWRHVYIVFLLFFLFVGGDWRVGQIEFFAIRCFGGGGDGDGSNDDDGGGYYARIGPSLFVIKILSGPRIYKLVLHQLMSSFMLNSLNERHVENGWERQRNERSHAMEGRG